MKRKPIGHFPVWYNKQTISLIKLKYKCWDTFKKTGCQYAYENFKVLRPDVKKKVKEAYTCYLSNISTTLKKEPKKFCYFFKARNNNMPSLPSTMAYGEHKFDNLQSIVDAFANFFETAFTSDQPSASLDNNDGLNVSHFDIKSIDETTVLLALSKLKPNMTAGPDLIPSFLIKDCAIVLTRPLNIISILY